MTLIRATPWNSGIKSLLEWALQKEWQPTPVFFPRGAQWAAVHRVAQSRKQLKRLSKHACLGEANGNPLQ